MGEGILALTPVAAALAVAALERVPALRFRPARLLRPHVATDVVYLLTGFVGLGWLGAAWASGAADWLAAQVALPGLVWPAVPFALQVVAALGAIDLGNYVVHWWLHRSDVLWEFHKAHHSSLHLDWLATFRSHLIEQMLRRALAPLLLIASGVPAAAVGVAAAFFFAWATLNHANLTLPLGILERVLITPRLHRLHHVPVTTERNLGTVFTWWDRLRGSLVTTDPVTPVRFGLPLEAETYPQDWGRQLVAPWARVVGTRTAARVPRVGHPRSASSRYGSSVR